MRDGINIPIRQIIIRPKVALMNIANVGLCNVASHPRSSIPTGADPIAKLMIPNARPCISGLETNIVIALCITANPAKPKPDKIRMGKEMTVSYTHLTLPTILLV